MIEGRPSPLLRRGGLFRSRSLVSRMTPRCAADTPSVLRANLLQSWTVTGWLIRVVDQPAIHAPLVEGFRGHRQQRVPGSA
jgi:hypothetical protein